MHTAYQLKKNNIAEYILYMWQIEELIRVYNCDITLIVKSLVAKDNLPESSKTELTEWWDNLIELMKMEGKEKAGHLQFLINMVNDINNLHLMLLLNTSHLTYTRRFQFIEPIIRELEMKLDPKPQNDIELMLIALYNSICFRLKGIEISEGTNEAIKLFADFLALLSNMYKKDQEGKLFNDEPT